MLHPIRTCLAVLGATVLGACTDQTPLAPKHQLQANFGIFGDSVLAYPVKLRPPQPTDLVSITAGYKHTCVQQWSGDVYCWGWNPYGQVGTGESDPFGQPGQNLCNGEPCVIAPTRVMNATQVDAGLYHTCALTSMTRPVGATNAMCWGGLDYFDRPDWIPGAIELRYISAGNAQTCGTNSTGIYCWGGGLPSTPTLKWSGSLYSQISLGNGHACAIWTGAGSSVECWGTNDRGQTGSDPAQFGLYQTILTAPIGSAVQDISAFSYFTCADQQTGTINCFGDNNSGQLGFGSLSPTQTYQPKTVSFLFCYKRCTLVPAQLHGVTTGEEHACALDANSAAYCWGSNTFGQLGDGTQTNATTPVLVAGGHTFRALAAGGKHTCGIGTDNIVYCWGDGASAQLGTGVAVDASTVPKPTAPFRWHLPPPIPDA